MIGNGIPVLVRRALSHIEAPEDIASDVIILMRIYARKYYCEKSTIMHGVKDCLEGLKKRGIPMSICTNKDETVAQMVVSALGLSSYFNAIVGSRPELAKKPDPSMLQIAAGAISSPMKTTMMIGAPKLMPQPVSPLVLFLLLFVVVIVISHITSLMLLIFLIVWRSCWAL